MLGTPKTRSAKIQEQACQTDLAPSPSGGGDGAAARVAAALAHGGCARPTAGPACGGGLGMGHQDPGLTTHLARSSAALLLTFGVHSAWAAMVTCKIRSSNFARPEQATTPMHNDQRRSSRTESNSMPMVLPAAGGQQGEGAVHVGRNSTGSGNLHPSNGAPNSQVNAACLVANGTLYKPQRCRAAQRAPTAAQTTLSPPAGWGMRWQDAMPRSFAASMPCLATAPSCHALLCLHP